MRASLNRSALVSLFAATILGCAGESITRPTAGVLEVHVTTGTDIDPDGFLLSVDGATGQSLPANGTVTWTGVGGSHTLAISGLAFNCDVTAAPTTATLALGQTTHVEVSASCTPFLSNAIVYVSDAFGYGEVMVSRSDGSRQTRLTSDQAVYAVPVVSPDGKSIAVARISADHGTRSTFSIDSEAIARGSSAEIILTAHPPGRRMAASSPSAASSLAHTAIMVGSSL